MCPWSPLSKVSFEEPQEPGYQRIHGKTLGEYSRGVSAQLEAQMTTSIDINLGINPLLLIDDPADSDFVRVGKAALARGFAITPIDPETKKPNMERWNTHPVRTYTDLLQRAFDHANDNVGVVMRHPRYGDCGHFVFDVDAPGVIEGILAETGHRLLDEIQTLIVQSQPVNKPWKMHAYFLVTEYSAPQLTKEVTDPSDYDLKGTGAGGQVLAAASIHPAGETYTYMTDYEIAPVPDWLVDWLVADIRKQRSAAAKVRHARKVAATKDPCVKPVMEEDIFRIMQSRAGSFASLGVDRADIKTLLLKQVGKFCVNGEKKAKSEDTKDLAHRLAYSRNLKIGTAPNFSNFGKKATTWRREGSKIIAQPATVVSREARLVAHMNGFPLPLPPDDAEKKILEVWPGYDKTNGNHRVALYRARKKARFIIDDTTGDWMRMDNEVKEEVQ
jgi:hypothetical protein